MGFHDEFDGVGQTPRYEQTCRDQPEKLRPRISTASRLLRTIKRQGTDP